VIRSWWQECIAWQSGGRSPIHLCEVEAEELRQPAKGAPGSGEVGVELLRVPVLTWEHTSAGAWLGGQSGASSINQGSVEHIEGI
jgi:hypothetical protein